MGRPANIFEIIYDITSKEDNVLTVSELCQMCNVSRSGYYRWIKAEETRKRKEEKDREDFDLILKAYMHRGYDKGAKGIHMQLLHMDPPVVMNEKKIRRLMKKFNLNCPIRKANPYRRMAKALKTSNYSDNLVNREFEKHGPRAILLTDITYLQYNGTFAYLSTILDAYTKQILSYVLSESLKVDFVLDTINQLVEKHGIDFNAETIVHSDQGCHYTSYSFIQILKDNGLRQSMSRRGNCWDNAPQESFYGHMKDEIGKRLLYCESFKDVKELIDDWIDFYNNERYQWQLAKLSPNEFYEYITTGVYPTKK
ncbi:MAG: IS3 family transposase [Holdemanella porci]